jgi:hypothetical protein
MRAVQSIKRVAPPDPLNTTLRLEELAGLDDGWLDGKGRAPAKEKLDWLAKSFETRFDPSLPLPRLYPTAEGGVQAEWSLNDWEVSLEIDLETQQGVYQALNLKDNSCTELTLSLVDADGWNLLNEALKQLEAREAEKQPRAS